MIAIHKGHDIIRIRSLLKKQYNSTSLNVERFSTGRGVINIRERNGRRTEVSKATARIISERGLDGVKVRDICAEVGYSTHVVSHYFENKKELLLFTLKECAARQVDRLKDAIARDDGLARCLEALLPLDEDRLVDARVWMVFWAQTSDPEIAAVQRDFGVRWRRLLVGTLRISKLLEPKMPRAKQDFIAERLQMIVAGIGIHGALGVWSGAVQRELLEAEVNSIMTFVGSQNRRSMKAAAMLAPPKTASNGASRQLALENNRLRKALIGAVLQIEALTETRSSSAAAGIGDDERGRSRPKNGAG